MDIKKTRYKIIYSLSLLSVWADHILRAFWPVIFGVLLLAGLALWGITVLIPAWILQVITFLFIFVATAYCAPRFRKPLKADIEKRLIAANKLAYNPFSVLRDKPAHSLDKKQSEKWQNLKNKSQGLVNRLYPALPRPELKHHDKKGLRFFALAVFVAGVLHLGADTGPVLKNSLIPERPGFLRPTRAELWLTPPEYTTMGPIHVTEDTETHVSLPEGSRVNAFVDKGILTPRFVTNTGQYKFSEAAEGGYTAEYDLKSEDRILKIKSGLISHMDLYVIQQSDTPPIVSLIDGPNITENNTIEFRFAGRDDYGLKQIEFVMRPDPMIAHRLDDPAPYKNIYEIGGAKFVDQTRALALYDHPWAGLPVEINLNAIDTKGQITSSESANFVLPEKTFTHPLARRLAEIRKELFWNADTDTFRIFAGQIFTLQSRLDAYNAETDIFLGLGSAGFRLLNMKSSKGANMASLRQLLWDLALRVEGGSSRVAAENLQNSLAEIMQALQNPNLSEEEFSALQEKLQQAIAEYMQSLMNELAAKLQEQGIDGLPDGFKDMVQQEMNPGDFLQQLQDTLKNGSREEIADALQKMQDMVEQMKNMQFQPMTAEMQKALAEIAKLKELITKQEILLDETRTIAPQAEPRSSTEYAEEMEETEGSIFENEDSAMPPMPSKNQPAPQAEARQKVESSDQAGKQAFIKMELGNIQQTLEEATNKKADFMTRAARAMEDSRIALNNDDPAASIPHQERALRELKQGMKNQMQSMASGLGKMITFSLPRPGNAGDNGQGPRDPFGRKMGPNGDMTGDVNITGEEERRRIQDIRDKILENADDVTDDPVGENYFDRLLERF